MRYSVPMLMPGQINKALCVRNSTKCFVVPLLSGVHCDQDAVRSVPHSRNTHWCAAVSG